MSITKRSSRRSEKYSFTCLLRHLSVVAAKGFAKYVFRKMIPSIQRVMHFLNPPAFVESVSFTLFSEQKFATLQPAVFVSDREYKLAAWTALIQFSIKQRNGIVEKRIVVE